jgi:tRNA1(Val) A37 N6-methylase TrmN6
VVEFKQFYTESNVSEMLASMIEQSYPQSCLELSAGEGALIDALVKRFPDIKITAADIDAKNVEFLNNKHPDAVCYYIDSTTPELFALVPCESFDVAVCNPPFKFIEVNDYLLSLITKMTSKVINAKKIRAEIVFLILNIMKIKKGGELAIILPDMFFSSKSFVWLRSFLISNFEIKKIIECNHKSFKKTEAKTHIYHIKKNVPSKSQRLVLVRNCTTISLSYKEFINEKKIPQNDSIDNYFHLFRGKKTGKECRASKKSFFHTSSYSNPSEYQRGEPPVNECLVKSGDILIARVGSRVLGRTILYAGTDAILSDCVFCLRINDSALRDYIFQAWEKDKAQWLDYYATGTCAKHISLENFKSYIRIKLRKYFSSDMKFG